MEEIVAADDDWLVIESSDAESHAYRIERTLHDGRTAFQDIVIHDTAEYGKMLLLDGDIQSAQSDEYIYHESLVHPAMTLHPAPRRVLIVGGGEGATAREVLRHPGVDHLAMVDIDGELVDLCRQHLPEWSAGAFDDPRFRLIVGDGLAFLRDGGAPFDVIIIDVADEDDDNAAAPIYSEDFYRLVRDRLAPGGIASVQTTELGALVSEGHLRTRAKLTRIFAETRTLAAFVPSFWCEWSFILGAERFDPARETAAAIDAELARRGLDKILRFYDGATHQRLVNLPKDVRAVLTRG